jgi:phosphoribosylanthranilate isomerase
MTRVKICGVTSEADLRAAVESGADAVGVVADVPVDSPREVDATRAAELLDAAPPFVSTVLVTMPETPEVALELAGFVDPDVLQLHGDLPPGDVAYVSANVAPRVVQAVSVTDLNAERYDGVADALLVDSADESGAGGTGRTHDWDVTREFAESVDSPVVLAGGLTPDNVREAVDTVDPFAVDVASGVEARGGEKDHDAVREFVAAAKRQRAVVE